MSGYAKPPTQRKKRKNTGKNAKKVHSLEKSLARERAKNKAMDDLIKNGWRPI